MTFNMMRAHMLRFSVVISESFAQFLTPEKLARGLSLSLRIYQCETYWNERGQFKENVDSTVRKTMRWESFIHRNSRESGFTLDKNSSSLMCQLFCLPIGDSCTKTNSLLYFRCYGTFSKRLTSATIKPFGEQ